MIEGLRVLPFWQALLADTPGDLRSDCTRCMKTTDPQRRAYLGCGYLPRMPGRLGLWSPAPMLDEWSRLSRDEREERPDPVMHCPGYTTALAEVQEVAQAYPHYEAGYLTEALAEDPSPALLVGLAVLKRAHNAWQAQEMKDRQSERERHG